MAASNSTSRNPFSIAHALVRVASPGSLIALPVPEPPTQKYADYTRINTTGRVISASSAIVALFQDVSNLIPSTGPLSQVLGITKELIGVIDDIRDNKDECNYLVERILRFLQSLGAESARMIEPVRAGTPTAARVYALLQYVNL